jgi:hypothetical protein
VVGGAARAGQPQHQGRNPTPPHDATDASAPAMMASLRSSIAR